MSGWGGCLCTGKIQIQYHCSWNVNTHAAPVREKEHRIACSAGQLSYGYDVNITLLVVLLRAASDVLCKIMVPDVTWPKGNILCMSGTHRIPLVSIAVNSHTSLGKLMLVTPLRYIFWIIDKANYKLFYTSERVNSHMPMCGISLLRQIIFLPLCKLAFCQTSGQFAAITLSRQTI